MSTQKQYPPEIQCLFNEQKKLCYPSGLEGVKKMLRSTAFFPGGSGLWLGHSSSSKTASNKPRTPKKKIMVLGNDFGSRDGYKGVRNKPYENLNSSSTWRNLLELLHRAGIKPKNRFFTNAYMGLRIVGKDTGPSPGKKDPKFVKRCQLFLAKQIAAQKPRLILVLGVEAIKLITKLSPDLIKKWKPWPGFKKLDANEVSWIEGMRFKDSGEQPVTVVALVHPSAQWTKTLKNRHYRGAKGEKAELKMLKDALKQSGLY